MYKMKQAQSLINDNHALIIDLPSLRPNLADI